MRDDYDRHGRRIGLQSEDYGAFFWVVVAVVVVLLFV